MISNMRIISYKMKILVVILISIACLAMTYFLKSFNFNRVELLKNTEYVTYFEKNDVSNNFLKITSLYEWNCFSKEYDSIEYLVTSLQQWKLSNDNKCQEMYKKFDYLFHVTNRTGNLVVSSNFKLKLKKWFSKKPKLIKEIEEQTITFVFNKLTNEQTIFNPLRDKRPVNKPLQSQLEYVNQLSESAKESCDFCEASYKHNTANDKYDRLSNENAYSTSNSFKYDAYHSLIIFRQHHPLNWTQRSLLDAFDLAIKWVKIVNSDQPDYINPIITWDLLPHASASQVHPHLHVTLTNDIYYGMLEGWYKASDKYFQYWNSNYFSDLLLFHDILGLSVRYKSAAAFASITPKKDNEIVVLAPEANEDFFNLFYFVTRTFIDDMENLCYSSVISLPSFNKQSNRNVAFARIVTRGTIFEVRSDVSSLELFAGSNVNIDPFRIAKILKESIAKKTNNFH